MYRRVLSNLLTNRQFLYWQKYSMWPSIICINTVSQYTVAKFSSNNMLTFAFGHCKTLSRSFHSSCLLYKTKGKKSGSGKLKEVIRMSDAAEVVDLQQVQNDMKSVIEKLKSDFALEFRVGSDIPLEKLEVVVEGDTYSLNEVAHVSKPSPLMVQVDMVDFPEFVPTVEKAIRESKWNLNPNVTGTVVKVPIPQVSAERRKAIAKSAKDRLSASKVDLRKMMEDLYKDFKEHEKISEDFEFLLKQQVKIYFDHYIAEAESLYKGKEKEILQPS